MVIGTLGTTSMKLKKELDKFGVESEIVEPQKSEILNTPGMYRKVLEV